MGSEQGPAIVLQWACCHSLFSGLCMWICVMEVSVSTCKMREGRDDNRLAGALGEVSKSQVDQAGPQVRFH